MKILPIEFEIPFFQYKSNNWDNKKLLLKNLIEKNSNKFHNSDQLDLCKSNTTFFSTNLINDFSKIFYEEIYKFSIESSLNLDLSETKSNAWFQIYNKYENHSVHNHGIGVSCICFIHFIKNIHTSPIFLAPFNSFTTSDIIQFEPNVEEGDVLFFPSPIHHFVPSNNSNVSRIIGAMNLSVI